MPPELTDRTDLLDLGWVTVLVGPLAIGLALLWAWSVRLRHRHAAGLPFVARLLLSLPCAVLASAAFWCGFQFIAQFLTLGTTWPLWVVAVLGGVALEIIAWLYRLEKTLVTRTRGRVMLGLRIAALVTLVLILVEPILSTMFDREINREVAILIDDSASMQLSDQRLSISEMLDRAAVFEVEAVSDRPSLSQWRQRLTRTRNHLSAAAAAHRAALPTPPEGQREQLAETLGEVRDEITAVRAKLISAADQAEADGVAADAGNRLRNLQKRLADPIVRQIDEAEKQLAAGTYDAVGAALGAAVDQLDQLDSGWNGDATAFDTAWFAQLDDTERKAITEAAARPRFELAIQSLRQTLDLPDTMTSAAEGEPADSSGTDGEKSEARSGEDATAFITHLSERYNLRIHRFARTASEAVDLEAVIDGSAPNAADDADDAASGDANATGDAAEPDDDSDATDVADAADEADPAPGGDASEAALTDLSGALGHILDNTSPETLAGVLLLSDGRHNGEIPSEDVLRRMGVQKSPLGAVAIGGRLGPVDSSILSLSAPESIYLGDRVVVRAEVKLDGLRGRQVKAVLRNGDEVVDEQTINVADVNQRSEIRFVHLPDEKGIFDYGVELVPLDEELFDTNNRWDFKLAVTDDRTNVLLVDSYPRWEFRYLRNLFYGRDKSVHLQYVLLNPDPIENYQPPKTVTASATRKFGEAEAHRLPTTEEEWRLFDVIIFGDIAPASIPDETWRIIADSVEDRGALFVSVAGARHMPHAFGNEDFKRLMPVTWEVSREPNFFSPEPSYHIELSNAGRAHAITRQSSSRAENSRIWGGLPPLRWRFVPDGVKDGAEVLAYARPSDADGKRDSEPTLDGSPDSVEAAIERLANRKAYEREHALITVQRNGLGKVAMLGFDQTWRLRYGVGDTLHHRFWGQVVRWGTGENLRSGNDFIRLGTDRLSYTPADPTNIVVKLLDSERRPVTEAELFAMVERDGERVVRQRLSYRTNSNGIYETSLADLPGPGEYTVEIEGDAISAALDDDEELDRLETEFMVVNTRNPVELAELTADRDFLSHAAQLTGGSVVEVDAIGSLIDLFGAPRETLRERRDFDLWDEWPLLVAFLGLLTTEWIVRRRGGLA